MKLAILVCRATTLIQTEISGWKFDTDIHGPQRMNPTDFGDPLTFPVLPPASQSFHSSCENIWTSAGWILTKILADIHGSQAMCPLIFRQVHIDGFEWNISTTDGWIAMRFGSPIHVPLTVNCINFGETSNFFSSATIRAKVQCFHFHDQIPAKAIFQSASAC